mgnify:CR=1 FL=1
MEEIDSNEYFETNDIDINEVVFKSCLLYSGEQAIEEAFSKLFIPEFGVNFKKSLKELLIPTFNLSLAIKPRIVFPEKILKPVSLSGKSYIEVNNVNLQISNKGFSGFKEEISGSLNEPAFIFGTQLTIDFDHIKLDLNRKSNFSEASHLNSDFIGCFIAEGSIGFPANWNHHTNSTAEVKAKNLLIGTGGISGSIGMVAKSGVTSAPLLKLKLGQDFNISLDAFSITFQQNAIINSTITGTLTIPGFKKKKNNGSYDDIEPVTVQINAFIDNNGEFRISAKPEQPLQFYIEKVARIDLNSLAFGKENDKFYIDISGTIDFNELIENLGNVDSNSPESNFPKNIPIKKLRVWEDGKMEFDMGVVLLPTAISLYIRPVKMAVTSLAFTSTELKHKGKMRSYNIIGFDGSLDVAPGGVSVRGDGVKIYYTTNNNKLPETDPEYRPSHIFIRVEGIGLEITVPSGASRSDADFYLKGYLAIRNPEGDGESLKSYAGQIAFAINQVKSYFLVRKRSLHCSLSRTYILFQLSRED